MPYTIICTCCYIAQMCFNKHHHLQNLHTIVEYAIRVCIACALTNFTRKKSFPRLYKNCICCVQYTRRVHSCFPVAAYCCCCCCLRLFSLPPSVRFIFYLSHLLLWYFLHSVWNSHFGRLHVSFSWAKNTLLKWAERCTWNSFFFQFVLFLFPSTFFSVMVYSFPHSLQVYTNNWKYVVFFCLFHTCNDINLRSKERYSRRKMFFLWIVCIFKEF